ncbi:MAG: DegT/DnrJ/EryC1/StrS family aminotransferase [Planctomycetaceae bacterium]
MPVDCAALLGGTPLVPEGPPTWPPRDPAWTEGLRAALADGSWGRYHGPWCDRLRETLRLSHQLEHASLTCSGTAAVELALRGLGVTTGDEVILAAYDFKGNFQDVLALGATPVLVDVRPDNWALDVDQVAGAVTPRTRAIIASHLHGAHVDMARLTELARQRQIGLLEDACQAPLATVQGRVAGTWGDVATLSFGGSKLVTAGRGGAVLTARADVAQRIRLHTQRGNEAYPLSELQAAALLPQWEQLRLQNAERLKTVTALRHAFADQGPALGLRPCPHPGPDCHPVFYKWGFQFDRTSWDGLTRDQLAQALRAEGVALDPGLRGLHKIHSSRRFRAVGSLDEASRADREILTLHHPLLLRPWPEACRVAEAVRKLRPQAGELAAWFQRHPTPADSPGDSV